MEARPSVTQREALPSQVAAVEVEADILEEQREFSVQEAQEEQEEAAM